MNINSITIVGRSTKDPEFKTTQTGNSFATFCVAVDGMLDKQSGKPEPYFFPVKCFGKTAETVAKFVRKGDMVGVSGRLTQRKYQSKDGSTRESIDIVADNVQFLTPKNAREQPAPQEVQVNEAAKVKWLAPDEDDLPF